MSRRRDGLELSGPAMWIVGLTVAGLATLGFCGFFYASEHAFAMENRQTVALITEKSQRVQTVRNISRTFYGVRYTFQDAAGAPQAGSGDLDEETWRRLKPGDALRIEHRNDRPDINRPWTAPTWRYLVFLIPLAAFGASLLAGAAVIALRWLRNPTST